MTPIYHLTHVDNLPRIIQAGGLWCDAERARQGWDAVRIAYQHLKDRRARKPVPVCAGGTLADYVPFYFANRSPMLYAIHTGYVEGYSGGQAGIVYLVASVERAAESGCPWCFTDGHALEAFTRFFDELDSLTEVDWAVIESWSWHNREDDFDRRRRKQAEFLVYRSFAWECFHEVGVIDLGMKHRVEEAFGASGHRPLVSVRPRWYY